MVINKGQRERTLFMAENDHHGACSSISSRASLGFWSLIICRMAVGVGEASFVALASPFIGDWFSHHVSHACRLSHFLGKASTMHGLDMNQQCNGHQPLAWQPFPWCR